MLAVVEFETEESDLVSCDSCGKDGIDAYEASFTPYHGEAEPGNYCDDCYPCCYCKECDPDYYNDILFDR